jgi:hypothetical protein
MSVNKYKPHLFVIPEDDADRQIADGFVLHPRVAARRVQVVEPAGGWPEVLDTFILEYLPILQQNRNAHVLMLIDFDSNPEDRRARFDAAIPADVRPRVFVVGPRDNPEALRQSIGMGGYEDIGRSLADDCDRGTFALWGHVHLQHNDHERLRLERLRLVDSVKPFLFN